jgi:hypothetical protein
MCSPGAGKFADVLVASLKVDIIDAAPTPETSAHVPPYRRSSH